MFFTIYRIITATKIKIILSSSFIKLKYFSFQFGSVTDLKIGIKAPILNSSKIAVIKFINITAKKINFSSLVNTLKNFLVNENCIIFYSRI